MKSVFFLVSLVLANQLEQKDTDGQIVHSHTFFHPLGSDPSREFWSLKGAANSSEGGVVLFETSQPETGSIWNLSPLDTDNFQLDVEFRIKTVTPTPCASEAFAIWIVDDPSLASAQKALTRTQLFGYDPQFKGLAVLFAVTDRAGTINPSISLGTSDGAKIWNPLKDAPTNSGIYFNFRTGGFPFKFRFSSSPSKGIVGQVKTPAHPDWNVAFTMKTGWASAGSFIGVSGSSLPMAEVHESDPPGMCDSLEIVSFTTTNFEPKYNSLLENLQLAGHDQDYVKELLNKSGDSNLDLSESTRLLVQILARHVEQSSFHEALLLRRIASMDSAQNTMYRKLQTLEAAVNLFGGVGAEVRHLKENLTVAHKKQEENLLKLESSLSDTSNHEQWAARSESLENSVRRQTALSVVLFLTFGGLLSWLGVSTWRKMKDMEKKHIL